MKLMSYTMIFLVVLGLSIGMISLSRVIAKTPELKVKEGEAAPDFTLKDQSGKPLTLSGLRGKWVVLYFYPKDDTPGCTKEACSFRDNILAIQQLNATVIGISVDSVASHKKFAEKYSLNFPILADEKHEVCIQYGVLKSYLGFKVAKRSTVIIDPEGIVRKVFPSVKPTDHALEIHRALKDLGL